MIVLYVSNGVCPACEQTKRLLRREGIAFEERSAVEHSSEVAELAERFGKQAPLVVMADGTGWSGFRPDLIAQYLRG